MSPQPGAMCTMPVPSPAVTFGLPLVVAAAVDHAVALDAPMTCRRSSVCSDRPRTRPPGVCWAGRSSNGPRTRQPIISAPFERAFDFVAALFFEDLSERFQLGRAFGPLPFRPAEAFFELLFQPLEFEVVFGEVIDGAVAFACGF